MVTKQAFPFFYQTEKFSNLDIEKEVLMFSEARKIHLIEEVLKIKNESVLAELEAFLKKFKHQHTKQKPSAHDFVGLWSKEDSEIIQKAIEDGCEQIHPDDWK